mgnify:CR=1 FL=1
MGLFTSKGRSTSRFFTNGAKAHSSTDGVVGSVVGISGRGHGISVASRLARWAGLSPTASGIEQLEKRELLYTLAVTQDSVDPATGLGTVRAYFGYGAPWLADDYIIPQVTNQTVVENFNEEPYGAVGSNTVFGDSNIRLVHNVLPPADIAIASDTGNDQQQQERYLRTDLNQIGEFFEFRPRQQNPNFSRSSDQVTFTIRANQTAQSQADQSGLDTNNVRVSLQFNGQTISSFTGQALRNLLLAGGNGTLGTGTFLINGPNGQQFDTVRVEQIGAFNLPGSSAFEVDDVSFRFRNPVFAGLLNDKYFGAVTVLTGPVGASVTLRDLNGDDIVRTIAVGQPNGSDVLLIDQNDDGRWDFNDGIGAITFNNVDGRTSFAIWGGTIQAAETQSPNDDFFESGFAFQLVTDVEAGLSQEFEQARFGYAYNVNNGQDFRVSGLPAAAGSVIIGSPWLRSGTDYLNRNPFDGGPPGNGVFAADDFIVEPDDDTSFIRADQGIFVPNGQSINSLLIHGILHGNSQFTGAVNRISVSYLVGSVTVAGDLGSLNTQSDAGAWAIDPNFVFTNQVQVDPIYRTEGAITVGRSVGEIAIGGRGQADITVIGDLNSPITRPARDAFNYTEREYVSPFATTTDIRTVIRDLLYSGGAMEDLAVDPTSLTRNGSQPALFGGGLLRNDTLMSAEYLGSLSTAVRVRGDLSGRNTILGEDVADVYSFSWDGTTDIVIQGVNDRAGLGAYVRIVDAQGRTVGAPESPDPETVQGDPNNRQRFTSSRISVRPRSGPGLYYLVVTDPQGVEINATLSPYSFVVSGLASTTFGSYRSGGGTGFSTSNGGLANAITLLSGSFGAFQVGTGYGDSTGNDASSTEVFNTILDDDNAASFHGGNISIARDLWALIAGSDIGTPGPDYVGGIIQFDVGGRVGLIATGLSPLYGNGPRAFLDGSAGLGGAEGDVNFLVLRVRGGGVGTIDIGGGVGMDQDPVGTVRRQGTGTGFRLETGDNVRGIAGDIGLIRVGFHVLGSNIGNRPFDIRTSDNSTIGAILVSQDAYNDTDPRSGIYGGPIGLNTGRNSDVRFIDTPQIDLVSSDAGFQLFADQPREFIDDGGARFSVSIVGGIGSPIDLVRVVPVDGGQGVVVSNIIADLTGGRTLRITSTGTSGLSDLISIGRIIVTGDAASRIEFGGTSEIDVYRIEVTGTVQSITNTTPRGDILSIDAEGLDIVEVDGNLGITQLVAFGPQSIAPFPGIDGAGPNTTVGGPVGTSQGGNGQGAGGPLIDLAAYGGGVYRPTQNETLGGNSGFLDDLGSPLDGRLEGVIVRGGNVSRIAARGAVQNVILQGDNAILGEVRVNSDAITPLDQFEGLLGTVYAARVALVDVGDGIVTRLDGNPLGVAGVFAEDDIGTVTGPESVTVPGSGQGGPSVKATQVSGVIIAGNTVIGNQGPIVLPNGFTYTFQEDGITSLNLPGGRYVDAYVASDTLDSFWTSFNYGEARFFYGDLGLIDVSNAVFTRNRISVRDLLDFTGTGTTFDASRVRVGGSLGTVTVQAFSNSTLLGTGRDFVPTDIRVQEDIDRITVTNDASDVTISAFGDFTGSFTARNFIRTTLSVNGRITSVQSTQDVRGSDIQGGQLDSLVIGRNLASSAVSISGEIRTITIGDRAITSDILVSGPDGRIQTITAVNGFQGRIRSSGPISTVTVTAGDFDAEVSTTEPDGDFTTLTAARDVIVSGFISGGFGTITAGRNIGSLARAGQALVVQRNITTVSAPAGTLYNDLRAGGTLGTVTLGGAVNKPGNDLTGRGSLVGFNGITSVVVTNGDFGGSILSYGNGIGSVTITNGSFLPGGTIAAYRGSIALLRITGGDLFGNVYADDDITSLVVNGAGQPFGNIGIDNAKTPFTFVDGRRNQLPQNVSARTGFDGALIRAGRDITSITVSGSVFESGFHAGRNIVNIAISGRIANNEDFGSKGSFFAAGDQITRITSGVNFADTIFIAGLTNLGSDNRPGGINSNEDTIKSGSIGTIISPAGAFGVTFVAGVEAGADGVYGDLPGTFGNESDDDALALGVSTIGTLNIGGSLVNAQVIADVIPQSVLNDSRYSLRRVPGQLADYALDAGTGFAGTQFSGTRSVVVGSATYTLSFTGPGDAFFTLGVPGGIVSNGIGAPDFTVTLRNSGPTSNFTVTSSTGTLENFHLWTNNNASVGVLTVNGRLIGNSTLLIDGGVTTVTGGTTGNTTNSLVQVFRPRIDIGGDVTRFAFTGLTDAAVNARAVGTLIVTGDFGSGTNSASFRALSLGAVTISGALRGLVSADQGITGVSVTGVGERAIIRAGRTLGPVTFGGQVSRSTISAGRDIGLVTIGGQLFDSSISAGVDLGRDAAFDGTGVDADTLRSGSIAGVTINGGFAESDITAGFLRGVDRFFGTNDDRIAGGRGSIGPVTINGTQTGSTRSTEAYRIASNGTVGVVTLAGQVFTGVRGNFALLVPDLAPRSVQIENLRVSTDSFIPSAVVEFNQPIDFSSLPGALSVSEVRGAGEVEIRLVQGLDYTLSYTETNNSLVITFARSVITSNLPVVPGRPGPGVYRIRLNSDVARGRLQDVGFDGNGDGIAAAQDDFVGGVVVGDAGDKLVAESINLNNSRYDFYAPSNLNFILDNADAPDNLPEANRSVTVDGLIGDHPDNDTTNFRLGGDVDLYSITLQAGQILRISPLTGGASSATFRVLNPDGSAVDQLNVQPNTVALPVPDIDQPFSSSAEQAYLIKSTATYIIAVGVTTNIANAGVINNPIQTRPGTVGGYTFTVEIFDDGDSGFTSSSTAGDGNTLVPAPLPIDFAGNDQVFGTPDDLSTILVSNYTFTLLRGLDGAPNTGDDIVTGTDGESVVSTRAGQRTVQTVDSAIGVRGSIGVPNTFQSDVDVFHLNNRQPIAPGQRVRLTLRLSATGSDLGSLSIPTTQDLRGYVQLGFFETTNSQATDDANLVFSSTDFRANGGTPNTTIAQSDATTYGFDANGDYFIDFIVPQAQGTNGGAGTFATYVQGIVNSDYQLEIITDGSGSTQRRTQRIFLETNGGTVDWLETGNRVTDLLPFDARSLAIAGSVANGQPAQTYILNSLVTNLNALFRSVGVDVIFSTNPGDFEFGEFSTIYLTSSNDPVNAFFDTFTAFNFLSFAQGNFNQLFNPVQPYGVAQRSDPFNARLDDEAVVFFPTLSLIGRTPSLSDIELLIENFTAAVARRAGELMGVRITEDDGTNNANNTFDALAANSVDFGRNAPAFNPNYIISSNSRALSGSADTVTSTNFFLGRQIGLQVLRQNISPTL